jgi:hypothetical protein
VTRSWEKNLSKLKSGGLSTCCAARRPARTAPVAFISSHTCPAGPDGRPDSPSGVTNHSCSRSKPSPPGLPDSSFGPAIDPSSDMDMKSTDVDTSTSCGLDTQVRAPEEQRESQSWRCGSVQLSSRLVCRRRAATRRCPGRTNSRRAASNPRSLTGKMPVYLEVRCPTDVVAPGLAGFIWVDAWAEWQIGHIRREQNVTRLLRQERDQRLPLEERVVVRMILDRDQVQSSDVCQLDQLRNRLDTCVSGVTESQNRSAEP